MRILITGLVSIMVLTNVLSAQNNVLAKPATPSPFAIGITDTLYSKELAEKRVLNIYLPDGYSKDSTNQFPVIYLLDGSANEDIIHVSGVVQFLTMIGRMRPSIVVGIANVDRQRDFTFPTTIAQDKKDIPTSGGSAKFIAFIEKELQPYIEKNYSGNAAKTIIGQSLGGLLATEILLKKPALFSRYIIVSPSLWWDNESLLLQFAGPNKPETKHMTGVCISIGAEGKQMENDAKKLSNLLQLQLGKNLAVNFLPLPKENHLTILHNSVYTALSILEARPIVK